MTLLERFNKYAWIGVLKHLIANGFFTTTSSGKAAGLVVAELAGGQAAEKTYISYIFGDDSVAVATASNTALESAPIDVSVLDPSDYAIDHIIAGSTAGDYFVETSRNGVDDWVQAFTAAYTAVGGYRIKGDDIGYAHFIKVTSTDSSTTVGTVNTFLMGRGA